jgi:diguanylate cyclase (GGDEF)-like protein
MPPSLASSSPSPPAAGPARPGGGAVAELPAAAPRRGLLALARRRRRMQRLHRQASPLVTLISFLAALAALALAVVPPASYFAAGLSHAGGALDGRAGRLALEVSQLSWRLQEPGGLQELQRALGSPEIEGGLEQRRILTPEGRTLVRSGPPDPLAGPLLTRRAAIHGAVPTMASLEVTRSLRGLAGETALLALLSGGLGLACWLLLRRLSMRLLDQALGRAAYLAAHDTLTGLSNRHAFEEKLAEELLRAGREGCGLALLCLDLDHFKAVNDRLGPAAGDALLREAARRLAQGLRASDSLARLAGDQFAVLQTGTPQPEGAARLAERLLGLLAGPFDLNGAQETVGVSIGIALGRPGQRPAELIHEAGLATRQAKQAGRGGFRFFAPEMNTRLQERRALEQDLRRAVTREQFRVAYQPQIDLRSGRVSGAEALLRWHRPGHGPVAPGTFIGLAEETGLILPLGAWVLTAACHQAARWPEHLGVAVNVSPVQFRHGDFCDTVEVVLRASGLAPKRLELEIPESLLLQDTEEVLARLERLRALGVRIALDDFDASHPETAYLHRFAFDKVKINRSFVQAMAEDERALAVIRAAVQLSLALNIRANAEGVETAGQAEMLLREGCGEAQGYHFGRPVPPEQFAALYLLPPGAHPQAPVQGAAPAAASLPAPPGSPPVALRAAGE